MLEMVDTDKIWECISSSSNLKSNSFLLKMVTTMDTKAMVVKDGLMTEEISIKVRTTKAMVIKEMIINNGTTNAL